MPRKKYNKISTVKHQLSEDNAWDTSLNSEDCTDNITEDYSTEGFKEFKCKGPKEFKCFNTFDYTILLIIVLSLSVYFLTYIESISWQLSSIGRIFLIKILPYYDWRPLKNKQCLIDAFSKENELLDDNLNCDICENIKHIEVYETIDEDILDERYIKRDRPVILSKGLEMWPNDSKFIQELRLNEHFSSSYPCELSTDILKDLRTIYQIIENVDQFDEFFLHFQNCDVDAMKIFRRFTFRPEALPPVYSPVLYNWLIWNKNYNTSNYKRVALVEKVAVFGQLFGYTYVSLIPRKNCEFVCPQLNIKLTGREMLIFSSLWDLEYRPFEKGENMAVILETSD
nr:uncharacterized protein LOC111502949 [Leptinotarsa decemlineata]